MVKHSENIKKLFSRVSEINDMIRYYVDQEIPINRWNPECKELLLNLASEKHYLNLRQLDQDYFSLKSEINCEE